MPTIADVKKLLKIYKPDDICAWDMWMVEDVQDRAKQFHDKEISKKDAERVLEKMDSDKDCNIGLNWDVMDFCMDGILKEKKQRKRRNNV
jgi:hypothetical protein